MIAEILIATMIGICSGIVTGLVPGVHINLVSVLLVSASGYLLGIFSPISFGAFIMAMSITHTFLDAIPSIFLGAPDSDTILNVLPGHRMLINGKGYDAVKLTVIGGLLCLIALAILMPLMVLVSPYVYNIVQPYIGWILLLVVFYIIWIEESIEKKLLGLFVMIVSGFLGVVIFSIPNLDQPLFAMLSGLFGVSTLLISLKDNNKIPEQKFDEKMELDKKETAKAVGASVFSGSLTGIFPALSSAQAAIIAMQLTGKMKVYGFMILTGGISMVNCIFSLVTFYTIDKARNGGIVAMQQIIGKIGFNEFVILMAIVLISGGVATLLALKLTKLFAKMVSKVNYQKLCYCIIFLLIFLTLIFNGLLGLLILFTSTMVGMLPAFFCVKRSLAMGCLLVPVIIYFIL